MIKQLFQGDHHNIRTNDGGYDINPLSAGPVLICNSEGRFILVDPGAFSHKDKLITELAVLGLVPSQIDCVLNTHHHLDHTSNNFLFHPYASIFTKSAILRVDGSVTIYGDLKTHRAKWPKDIEIMSTPGHTEDHVSFVYKENGKTYVCAGDAVREDILIGNESISGTDKKKFMESASGIFDVADVIFPGHGRIIVGEILKELRHACKNKKSK